MDYCIHPFSGKGWALVSAGDKIQRRELKRGEFLIEADFYTSLKTCIEIHHHDLPVVKTGRVLHKGKVWWVRTSTREWTEHSAGGSRKNLGEFL